MKKIYQLAESTFVPSDDMLIAFEDKNRGAFVRMTVGELMRKREKMLADVAAKAQAEQGSSGTK